MASIEVEEYTIDMLADGFYDPFLQFTDSTLHRQSAPAPSTTSDEGHASYLAFPPPRRVRFDPRYVKPNLPQHHTAPTNSGVVREKDAAAKMYHTFDTMDAPGDTQPDSQMFKQYTSGLMGSTSRIFPGPPQLLEDDGMSEHAPTDDIELVGSSQSQESPNVTSPIVMNDEPETQYHHHDPLTSPLKFETPAVAGKKRGSQVLNTTPATVLSASAFFGFGDSENAISLTQAFNATQAATSPIRGAPSEDPVFQRPSPNFARRSSPPLAMSSPIKGSRKQLAISPPLRSSSEPRADYETMEQSLERRSRGPPDAHESVEVQNSWELPTEVEQRFNKQREKQRLDQEAAKYLANVSAPSPARRHGKKRGVLSKTSNSKSLEKPRASKVAVYDGPYDSAENDSQDELSQHIPLSGDGDDSPDELSQDIPSSSGVSRKRAADNQVQVPNTSSHPRRTLSGQSVPNLSQPVVPSTQSQRESPFKVPTSQALRRNIHKWKSSKEAEIVMDSQPDANTDVPAMPDRRFPSSPSTTEYSINQTTMNGKTGFSSQAVSSSIPPVPPGLPVGEESREENLADESQRVPSSPPIVSQADDIIYDEHAYDEHSDGEPEPVEVHSTQEDVDMDEDDLPIALEEKSKDEDAQDAEMSIDDEIPETIEEGDFLNLHNEDEELIRSSRPEEEPCNDGETHIAARRASRQSTIPETDVLEETQPMVFPESQSISQRDTQMKESTVNDTNSTDLFHTGKEHQPASQADQSPARSTKVVATVQSPSGPAVRSLLDIANQPATQRSTELGDIEIPQLVFAADSDDGDDTVMHDTSPARPSKRRKVYTAKKTYRDHVNETDPMSEQEPSAPDERKREESLWTPSSVNASRKQEEHGAPGATRAWEEVTIAQPASTLKSKSLFKPSLPLTPRKGALKAVNKTLIMTSPDNVSPKSALRTAVVPTRPTPSPKAAKSDTEMHDADDSAPEVDQIGPAILSAADDGEAPIGEFLYPHRVLAHWPGRNFYPATCLGRTGMRGLRVRYDDGNEIELDGSQVRPFDLLPRDHVKVDLPGMKKQAYIVIGLKNKIDTNEIEEFSMTDRRGYATVVLEEKQRDSLPVAKAKQPQKHIEVSVGSVYLTTTLWGRIRERTYVHDSPSDAPVTPVPQIGTPTALDSSAIPMSTLGRRSTLGHSLLRDSTVRAASVASSIRSSGTAFSNMAFAITLTKDSSDKEAIAKLITSNGGQILDSGFSELFDVDTFDAPASSEDTSKVVSGLDGLLLKREYKNLGFVALISDAHSRRTKHFQALALNIPCLHLRWVNDSLSVSRALPFSKYLLPAGVSRFLDPAGVVRSRSMTVYDPASEDVTFIQMLKGRSLLLTQRTILFITGKTKKEIGHQQPYIFLTHALGPGDVGTCTDLAAAKQMMEDGEWDWVYVDGGAEGAADAAVTLFGEAKSPVSKKKSIARKRKRDDNEPAEPQILVRSCVKNGKKVRITCDEFLIQSLILGALIEE